MPDRNPSHVRAWSNAQCLMASDANRFVSTIAIETGVRNHESAVRNQSRGPISAGKTASRVAPTTQIFFETAAGRVAFFGRRHLQQPIHDVVGANSFAA